jgi:hypothetical protein
MTSLDARLQEAIIILEMLRDEYAQTRADLWQAEQRHIAAIAHAAYRDRCELEHWMRCEQSYASALQQWRVQQSQEAQVALLRKKVWGYQLVVLFACLLSCGLFLVLEMREIQTLQHKRDNPPLGNLQRTWSHILQDTRQKIDYLHSLHYPRQTPEMRETQQEVFSLRKKQDMLGHQVMLQEARIDFLRRQLSSSSII